MAAQVVPWTSESVTKRSVLLERTLSRSVWQLLKDVKGRE